MARWHYIGRMGKATEGLADDLARQRDFLTDREPVYGRLLDLLAEALPGLTPDLERAWADRTFFAWYDRPLLLLASLRDDALAEGDAHPLWSSIGEGGVEAAGPTTAELRAAVAPTRERFWSALSHRTVQTNETSRAVAWLWPACLVAEIDPDTPLHLVDVGTSAGLNLVADDPLMPRDWTDQDGASLAAGPLPPIRTRLGLDRAPLDVRRVEDARWLRACTWPSDTQRLDRLDLAIAAFVRASRRGAPPELERCPIEDVPARAASVGKKGRLLVLQTVMRDYLSPGQQQRYEAGLGEILESRPPGNALWVELEVNHEETARERAAQLRAHVAGPDGRVQVIVLAATHPHPKKLVVERAGVERLSTLL